MDDIRLSSMVEVSRNCGITNRLHAKLNDQLDDETKSIFLMWLRIINEEQSTRSNDRLNRYKKYQG